jgi:hypothetical protein
MTNRPISITDAVDRFLLTYERYLLQEGCSPFFIDQVARELFEIIFEKIPKAKLAVTYLDKDPNFDWYSRYSFSEGNLFGIYSSNGSHVILTSIDVYRPAWPEVAVGMSAA